VEEVGSVVVGCNGVDVVVGDGDGECGELERVGDGGEGSM
jgi:hypothetical protein